MTKYGELRLAIHRANTAPDLLAAEEAAFTAHMHGHTSEPQHKDLYQAVQVKRAAMALAGEQVAMPREEAERIMARFGREHGSRAAKLPPHLLGEVLWSWSGEFMAQAAPCKP